MNYFFSIFFIVLSSIANAGESSSIQVKKTNPPTFWLTNIVSLEKTKVQEPPALSTQGGYEMIGNITVEGNTLTLTDSGTCSVIIEKKSHL